MSELMAIYQVGNYKVELREEDLGFTVYYFECGECLSSEACETEDQGYDCFHVTVNSIINK